MVQCLNPIWPILASLGTILGAIFGTQNGGHFWFQFLVHLGTFLAHFSAHFGATFSRNFCHFFPEICSSFRCEICHIFPNLLAKFFHFLVPFLGSILVPKTGASFGSKFWVGFCNSGNFRPRFWGHFWYPKRGPVLVPNFGSKFCNSGNFWARFWNHFFPFFRPSFSAPAGRDFPVRPGRKNLSGRAGKSGSKNVPKVRFWFQFWEPKTTPFLHQLWHIFGQFSDHVSNYFWYPKRGTFLVLIFGSLGPQFWYRVGPLFEHTKVAFCEVDCHQFRKEIALARTD